MQVHRSTTHEERMRTAVRRHFLTGTKQSLADVQHAIEALVHERVMTFRRKIERIKNTTR